MKCIDCKIDMERIDRTLDGTHAKGRPVEETYQVYRCPRCFVEIEVGDEDYEGQ
jgi:hypothetical protein